MPVNYFNNHLPSWDELEMALAPKQHAAQANVNVASSKDELSGCKDKLNEIFIKKTQLAKNLAAISKQMLADGTRTKHDVMAQLAKDLSIPADEVRDLVELNDTLNGEHKRALKKLKAPYKRLIHPRILYSAIKVKNMLSKGASAGSITAVDIDGEKITVTFGGDTEALDLATIQPDEFLRRYKNGGGADDAVDTLDAASDSVVEGPKESGA